MVQLSDRCDSLDRKDSERLLTGSMLSLYTRRGDKKSERWRPRSECHTMAHCVDPPYRAMPPSPPPRHPSYSGMDGRLRQ